MTGLRFLLAKLSECSVFVWIGRSTVFQPMEESGGLGSYNGDDVIPPFSALSQSKCVQTKGKIPLLFTPPATKFGEF